MILLVRLVAWVALLQSEENWRLLIAHRAKEIDDSACMRGPSKVPAPPPSAGRANEKFLSAFKAHYKKSCKNT